MKAKKTSITHMDSVGRHDWSGAPSLDLEHRGLYTEHFEGEQYDFVFDPKPETGRLIVFFSGDARRTKFEPPVFQRWSWASKFPANCLYFSDPALYHSSNLGLAWYAGHDHGDYLEHIASIVKSISAIVGVSDDKYFSYGSSGGGFAAIRFARHYPGVNVIAINPQTDLWKYPAKWTDRLSRVCYGVGQLQDVPDNHSYKFTVFDSTIINQARSIFLAQNVQDSVHYKNHFLPFKKYTESHDGIKKLTAVEFSDASGHAGAENQSVFDEIISQIIC